MTLGPDGTRTMTVRPGALCIYGILEESDVTDRMMPGCGIGGGQVRLMAAESLRALASPAPDDLPVPVRRYRAAHAAVLERIMAFATVLPVPFGTTAPDEAALVRFLTQNRTWLCAALQDIAGRVELVLRASWHIRDVPSEIIDSDAELRRLRDRVRSLPATETCFERVELGRRVEAALAQRRATDAAAIVADVAPLADREVRLPASGDAMILHRAFLVPRAVAAQFDARLQALSDRARGQIDITCRGPVPPYHFARTLPPDWRIGAA